MAVLSAAALNSKGKQAKRQRFFPPTSLCLGHWKVLPVLKVGPSTSANLIKIAHKPARGLAHGEFLEAEKPRQMLNFPNA